MRATVDPDLCTSCELCVDTCPEVFSMGDTAATTIVDEVPEEVEEKCKEAADGCPVEAITIEE